LSTKPKVLIIEDKEEDLDEVLDCLGEADFTKNDILGKPNTYEEALATLDARATEIDLVLLDLNLPRNEDDARPEKGHGKRLLDHVHELNKRAQVQMHVIIVSAEELAEDFEKDMMMRLYEGTLVGSARKDALAATLKANLRRLRRDPMRNHIAKLEVGILDEYDGLKDTANSPLDRIEKARTIAIRLTRNEMDVFEDRLGASERFADNLNGLVEELKCRFDIASGRSRADIKAILIKSDGGWGRFLWRGWHVDHLYALNNYRRHFKHEEEQPYVGVDSSPNQWAAPATVLESLRDGRVLVQIVDMIVCELLDWYLPWHEQVYLPWRKTKTAGGTSS
jgi:DNA-binding NarL/FixJ family response regulator